ncbi:MAG: hypothetical protein AB8H47_11075 [Bacteroidia bacterium]
MKKLSTLVFLLQLLCHPILAQKASLVKEKDVRMRKIDIIVSDIEKDSTLTCFITNRELTTAENLASVSPEKLLEHQLANIVRAHPLVQSTPTLFYLKDSLIIKIVYDKTIYYFLDDELIFSNFECQGRTDLLTQCKPAYSRTYNYYWNGKYHKSMILAVRSGNCDGCASGYLYPWKTKKKADWLLKRLHKIY